MSTAFGRAAEKPGRVRTGRRRGRSKFNADTHDRKGHADGHADSTSDVFASVGVSTDLVRSVLVRALDGGMACARSVWRRDPAGAPWEVRRLDRPISARRKKR